MGGEMSECTGYPTSACCGIAGTAIARVKSMSRMVRNVFGIIVSTQN
jgi:hypothetical protein